MNSKIEQDNVLFLYGFSLENVRKFSQQKRVIHFSLDKEETLVRADGYESYTDPSDEVLKCIAWRMLFNSLQMIIEPSLTVEQKEAGVRIIERFKYFHRGAQAVIADVRDMGKMIVGNISRNILLLTKARAFLPFKNAFPGVPAVICGAGPSLEKGLPFLPAIRQKALVMAGGSALNVLTHASFAPHFAAAIDPNPPAHLFRHQVAVETPLFYQNRVANRLLADNHNIRVLVPDNVSYPIEQWLMQSLGLETIPFEAGWNVATFCLHIAVAMGCNPIIIAGVDLCHRGGERYSPGVSMPTARVADIPLEMGKETKADFLLAADWIEEFVASHPATKFINASTGGLQLRGMEEMTLEKVALGLSAIPCDLEGKIFSLLEGSGSSLQITEEKAVECLSELKNNIAICLSFLEKMIAVLQKWYPDDGFSKGEYILLEVEFEENPLYTYMLLPLWDVWQWVLCTPEKNDVYNERLQKLLFFQKALQEIAL